MAFGVRLIFEGHYFIGWDFGTGCFVNIIMIG